MPLQKNQIIPLTIDSLSSDGNGVGRFEGQAVFVPCTAPGDVLQVRVVKVCRTYAFGIVDAVVSPGPGRQAPDCPIFGKCGGCDLRHMTYAAELQAKQGFVADAMRRLGGLDVPVKPILPSPAEDRYRNKVQYPLYRDETGAVRAGFYANRSHRVVPCDDCRLQPELLNQIAAACCRLLTELRIPLYDETAHKGLVRHLYLRHAVTTGRVMVCLVCNGRKLPQADVFCRQLTEAFAQIESIVLNVNTRRTNVITGEECITLYGTGTLRDEMGGVPVELGPLSFYQVNTAGANQLYAEAARLADPQPTDTVLDLYCGAGTIGLSMAARCGRLIGVEIVPQAIESAWRNAKAMGAAHAEFFCADAGQAAQRLAAEGLAPDIIVLDPPRKGCDAPTLDAVLAMIPRRVVMVSCNPATAARDVRYLADHGYAPQLVQPADMFPRTKHVEAIILLQKETP